MDMIDKARNDRTQAAVQKMTATAVEDMHSRRAGLREMGLMLIEDGHWEVGSWMHAVASATQLKALPLTFVKAIGTPVEETFAKVEDNYVGILGSEANRAAFIDALAQANIKFMAERQKRIGRLFTAVLTKPIRDAILRVHPIVSATNSSPYAMKAEWVAKA